MKNATFKSMSTLQVLTNLMCHPVHVHKACLFSHLPLAPGAGVDVSLGALDLGDVDVLHRPQGLG